MSRWLAPAQRASCAQSICSQRADFERSPRPAFGRRPVSRNAISIRRPSMGMPLRSYYSFEAGQGPLDIAKIWRFAQATDSDPAGIMDTLMLGSPEHALRSMDNKIVSIQLASFRRFSDKVGDRMTHIGPSILIEAFKRPFDSLEDHLDKRDESTERWLAENLPKMLPPEE